MPPLAKREFRSSLFGRVLSFQVFGVKRGTIIRALEMRVNLPKTGTPVAPVRCDERH